ncbi:hypothetical protein BGZ46_000232 [Entomortierella lignicola]|nr:hypothetical protein BGZ46_000232 [Entomortierella lignicola]
MQTTIITSIAICAQVSDNLLIQLFHRTCGIQVHPTAAFICVTKQLPSSSPFPGTMIMSAGALIALVLILPLCLMNLSENIWMQIMSCIIILLIFIQWIVTFFQHGLVPSRVPVVGKDLSQTFGSILFNYGFVTAVPSLANAKASTVSLQKTVGCNISLMTTIFMMVSILGAMAFKIPNDSSLVQVIVSSPNASTLSKITGFVFPIAALVTSIPVNMIVLRYNLIQSRTCNKGWASFLSGGLPWLFAIPGMTGSVLPNAVGWCSLLFVSAATFVIPFVLFIFAKRYTKRREMTESEGKGVPSMIVVTETVFLDEKTGSKFLGKVAFWGKGNSGMDKKDIGIDSPSKSKEKGERNVNSIMAKQEYSDSGVVISKYEENNRQDPESEKMTIHNPTSSRLSCEELSSSSHHRTRSQSAQIVYSIAPPFLGGNNYAIPGFAICQTRSGSLSRPSSDLALHRSRSEEDTRSPNVEKLGELDVDLENGPSQGQFNSKPAMRALPKWFPVPAVKISWISLGVTLVGIIATISVRFVQLKEEHREE